MNCTNRIFRFVSLFCAISFMLVCICSCGFRSNNAGNKTIIHLAMVREINDVSSTFRNAISSFNEENDMYTIAPVYYKDEASLQRAVISGDAIDIIDLFGLSTDVYLAKGVLADLYTFLDADSELSRKDFVPAFLEMAEQNGHLFQMSASFAARSLLAPKAVVGNLNRWDENTFIEIASSAPAEYYVMDETSALDFLSIYLTYSIQNYVNINTETVSLRNGAFCDMLTYCRDAYRANGQVPLLQYISTIFGAAQYVTFLREQANEYALVGFPGADGNGALRYFAAEQLAISALSEQSDGAWTFLKYLISSTDPNGIGFPVLQTNFDHTIQEAMEDELDEQGNVVVPGMTEAERNSLLQWLDNASGPGGAENTSDMIDIILEEAVAYISGDKSLDETLSLMESRLGIYLAEVN